MADADLDVPDGRAGEVTDTSSEQESDEETPSTPLKRLVEDMRAVHDPDKTAEKAFHGTFYLILLGLPGLALWEDWGLGGWLVLLPFGIIFFASILREFAIHISPIFKRTKLGLIVAHTATFAAVAPTLFYVWAPFTSVWLFFGCLIVLFIILFQTQLTRDRLTAEALRIHPILQEELRAAVDEQLHVDVASILDRAADERVQLQRVLADSLSADAAVDSLAILREYDVGFADLLDRSLPLSTLLGQALNGSETATTQSIHAQAVFDAVADSIHELVVAVLGYAGSRDSSALDDLAARTDDLRNARQAHAEVNAALTTHGSI